MTPLERLKKMIGTLSPQELAELRAWVSTQELPAPVAEAGACPPAKP